MTTKRTYSYEERTSEKGKTFSFLFLPFCTLFPRDCLHSIKKF